jgi:hypothetical protein
MNQDVLRVFVAALGFGLYFGLPGVGSPRAEAALAALDRTTPRAESGEEAGSDDSSGEEQEENGDGEESEEESD